MKTIGLLGGMSWESSAVYYKLINQEVAGRLGGLHSARCLMWSVDFAEIAAMQSAGEWQQAGEKLADAARRLEQAGADAIVLCTNTMHKVADIIDAALSVPFLHQVDIIGQHIKATDSQKVLLLGTRFTMEQDFYGGRLAQRFGLDVRTPDAGERDDIHRIIFEELCRSRITAESRQRFLDIIQRHVATGIDGVILGCTEIPLLVQQADVAVPVFDTTALHAKAAVDFALAG